MARCWPRRSARPMMSGAASTRRSNTCCAMRCARRAGYPKKDGATTERIRDEQAMDVPGGRDQTQLHGAGQRRVDQRRTQSAGRVGLGTGPGAPQRPWTAAGEADLQEGTVTVNLGIRMATALLATVACVAAAPVSSQETSSPAAIAAQLLDHMDAGRYAQAESMFNADMANAVPADKLRAVWESLPAQAGAAKGRGNAMVDAQGGTTLVTVPLLYEKTELTAKVAVAADGRIAGFMIQPAPPSA